MSDIFKHLLKTYLLFFFYFFEEGGIHEKRS